MTEGTEVAHRTWGDGLTRTAQHVIEDTRMRSATLDYWTRCSCGITVTVLVERVPDGMGRVEFGDLCAAALAEKFTAHREFFRG